MDNPIKSEKPIDRWLGIGGIAVAIVLFLIPKTPLVVVSSLVLMFGLLIHPIWHFWWIEAKPWRKWAATALLVVALWYLGQAAWPPGSTISQPHFITTFGHWLFGPHGRWFDRAIGGVGALALIFFLLFFVALGKAVSARRPKAAKGGLDYKMDAETAMSALPPMLEELTKIMTEVAPALTKHAATLVQAKSSSTAKQIKIIKAAASSLDGYSTRLHSLRARYTQQGKLLSDGFIGLSAWIGKTRPSKASVIDFAETLRSFASNVHTANETLNAYITGMIEIKGASSVLDAAIDRHVDSWGVILLTNGGIFEASTRFLGILDALA